MKKEKAITLLEILISITIISMLMIMLFSVVAKKAKTMAEKTSGTFNCYKDPKGKLNQRVELTDGTIQEIMDIQSCNFSFPNTATKFEISVVGGGGGGGKVSTVDAYSLSSTKTYSYSPFDPPDEGCTPYPILTVDGRPEPLTDASYSCNGKSFRCTEGDGLSVTNSDTTIKKMFDNTAFELIALKDRTLFVKGGDNLSNEQGTVCAFKVDLYYGENVEFYYNGDKEFKCGSGAIKKAISASAGRFKSETAEVIAKGKTFQDNPVSNDFVNSSGACTHTGAASTRKKDSMLTMQDDRVEYILITPKLQYSTGGDSGAVITNKTIKLGGKNIVIPKNNIGNGGLPGENGGDTIFEEYNIKAKGGASGDSKYETVTTSTSSTKILGEHLEAAGYGQYRLSTARQITELIGNKNNDGELSEFARENVLPGVVAQEQHQYKGIGAQCTIEGCSESTSPRNESFGSGGGGGSSKITYEPYYKLLYEKPNYMEDSYDVVLDIKENIPEMEYMDGSAGMGGAIVIKWE